jgi:hypothetical protein
MRVVGCQAWRVLAAVFDSLVNDARNQTRRSIMVRWMMLAAILAALVSTPLVTARGNEGDRDEQEHGGDGRVELGLAISPVPMNLEDHDKELVGLGSYLVNAVAGCTDCHTHPNFAPGGNPFRGQPKKINAAQFLAGGRQFGPFTSRNLTPEAPFGRPAGLTYDMFVQVMRQGKDFDNAHPQFGPLLQVMPWPGFQSMTDQDLRAIYEYLSSIPHAEAGPPG